MDKLDINTLLNRNEIEERFRYDLNNFEENKEDLTINRGFFFYGNPGVGKTVFVTKILEDLGYEILRFDSNDVRNKSVINSITKMNMNEHSVISMFNKNRKKKVILMDEIDSMNNGDKGGLALLNTLIRAKKTKKQREEEYSMNPVICIGNYHFDKKTTLLEKISNSYEISEPCNSEMSKLIEKLMPKVYNNTELLSTVIKYISSDLRKLEQLTKIYESNEDMINEEFIENTLHSNINNEFSKDLTRTLLNKKMKIEDHNKFINETDRTSISLLFHENIIDKVKKNKLDIKSYIEIIKKYCYADYLDRVTFQKQIWIFNELTSLLKTINSNNIFFDYNNENKKINKKTKDTHIINRKKTDIRFTKVLTKYSTEYNTRLFLTKICNSLHMSMDDLLLLFISKLHQYEENASNVLEYFSDLDITKLDVERLFRYIKNIYDYNICPNI